MLYLKELEDSEALRTITLPLIVPTEKEVLDSKELDLSKSPLNACYSKPLVNEKTGKKQSWFDVRLTVEGENNLPSRKEWFYLVTDHGYAFKACFAGRKVKWLSSFENSRLIGKWLKGIFIDCEIVRHFDYVDEDPRKTGIITKEDLEEYGGDQVVLKKTTITEKDNQGIERDVWLISFPFKL
ncbi:hypothetical protein OVS_00755 [Mycoplasma ovis str. Michigan]|uniref:Restriction endonuclease type II NgoFVII C-terminal B3-like DNA-binding domain-containing protein n=1 Tax=Mycoplasma ovis str. Michigan TaxID=1415773 RepID=A0ABM5P0Z6_9MOLU|nr:restriction endonuclease PLD domain-containing protein [Mycoplasma ovis]AHC40141.1 hypothetical protein OVS_00755 [Mycoplasma ovis str. Michigan]